MFNTDKPDGIYDIDLEQSIRTSSLNVISTENIHLKTTEQISETIRQVVTLGNIRSLYKY
jgi:hypothetical protein